MEVFLSYEHYMRESQVKWKYKCVLYILIKKMLLKTIKPRFFIDDDPYFTE